ncbi:MAG: M50 family metallopeptidase [Rhizomicrobium sp.]
MQFIQQFFSGAVYTIPAMLFLITVVVFFHELGHFSVARLFGVRVETFSIGFGRAIAKWTDKKGTLWKIGWIPLGGYVKFYGDADGASTPDRQGIARMSAADRAVSFPFKPLWQRALIVFAGPATNLVLAVLILTGLFMFVGVASQAPSYIGSVQPHSAADTAGIRAGDRIVAIDGVRVDDYRKLSEIVSLSAGQRLPIVLDRGGKSLTVYATPRETVTEDGFGGKLKIGRLGITSDKYKGSFARLGPIDAFGAALDEIHDTIATTWRALTHSSNGLQQISGPIGTTVIAGKVAALSLVLLVHLAALLSVSVGLVNLFPIPLLDGGHLLYYAFEGVLGRPLGERAQDVGFRLGLAVVLGIFILATWNDLVRLNLF